MFKLKKRLIRILAGHTGKDENGQRDSDRDYYMTSYRSQGVRRRWTRWSSPARK